MTTLAAGQTAAKFQELERRMTTAFVQREEVARSFVLALLTGQHIVLVGPPGTGKSALARYVCASIEGATYFEWLLGRTTVPEEILGPYNLPALEAGRFERITSGKLPEAHIAFLDEVFKASSALLNLLLSMMNERVFHNGTQPVPVPLRTLIGASNEYPDPEEDSHAIWDRFLFRHQVAYLNGDDAFRRLLGMQDPSPAPVVTLQDIATAQAEVAAVDASQAVELLVDLRKRLQAEGILLSDRRWRQSVRVLQAAAWLEGQRKVDAIHLEALVPVLWDEDEHLPKVRKAILQLASPMVMEAQDLLDQAREILAAFQGADEGDRVAKAVEAAGGLKKILTRLERLANEARGANASGQAARIEAIADQVRAMHADLMKEALA